MKKAIFKSLLVVMISIGLMNYLFYLKTGEMPLKNFAVNFSNSLRIPRLSDFSFNFSQESVLDGLDSVGAKISSDSKTRIYKWTDEQGVVHYSEELPINNSEAINSTAQEMIIDADTNLIKGMAAEEFTSAEDLPRGSRARLINADSSSADSGINPDASPLEQAQQAKQLLEQRNQNQQKVLDSI